jgi:aminoglycoside phosphotransferase (APT) family kinase protein
MTAAQHYDTLDFSDYLDGTNSQSMTLWLDHGAIGTPAAKPFNLSEHKAFKPSRKRLSDGDAVSLARYSQFAEKHLGRRAVAAEYPGGKGRDSWRLKLDNGDSVIVTRRDNPTRAVLEARVLERLHAGGAPVPQPLAFNGLILLQEYAGANRASDQLAQADAVRYTQIMRQLIDSLGEVYRAADSANLQSYAPVIGRSGDWVTALIDRTALIGHAVGIASPRPKVERMEALFQVIDPEFVKWDARAANAVMRPSGAVCWIDWEHCGARHRLDDLAWLLADETVPEFPAAEMELIQAALPLYAQGPLGAMSAEYLFTFGVCHMAVRLARILANKGDDQWNDVGLANPTDEERVDLNDALRLCRRAQRWSQHGGSVRVLGDWFKDVAEALQAESAVS